MISQIEQELRQTALDIAVKRLGERTIEPPERAVSELIQAAARIADWIRGEPVEAQK